MRKWALISLLPLVLVSDVRAQVTTGLNITKTCPSTPVAPGSMFTCSFTVENRDPANDVINLAVTNTVPFPGGTTSAADCRRGGASVNSLGPNGSATAGCAGVIDETAPACGPNDIGFTDEVAATGDDTNGGAGLLPVSASTTNTVIILACQHEEIPALSYPFLGLLVVGLSAIGLLVMMRRH